MGAEKRNKENRLETKESMVSTTYRIKHWGLSGMPSASVIGQVLIGL